MYRVKKSLADVSLCGKHHHTSRNQKKDCSSIKETVTFSSSILLHEISSKHFLVITETPAKMTRGAITENLPQTLSSLVMNENASFLRELLARSVGGTISHLKGRVVKIIASLCMTPLTGCNSSYFMLTSRH